MKPAIDPGRSPECWEYDVVDPDSDVRVKTRAGFSLDASSISNVAALDVAALETLTDADPVEDTLVVHDDSVGDNKQLSLNGLIDAAEALVDIGGTDTRCPIGAGIVACGGNDTTGYWELSGNGKLEQWGFSKQGAGVLGKIITYPVPFKTGSIPIWTTTLTNHHGGTANVVQTGGAGTYADGIPTPTGFSVSFITIPAIGTPAVDIGFCWRAVGKA